MIAGFLRRRRRARPQGHRYRVTLYCPDDRIAYNGRTPDEEGIGGGITARVRVLRALARAGHEVTAYVHCDVPGMYDGVRYLHFSTLRRLETDIFIATTSGGQLSFAPLRHVKVNAALRIAWVHGTQRPEGLSLVRPDYLYVPSNFIRTVAMREWDMSPERIFVTYNGVENALFEPPPAPDGERNPYSLVYMGYPAKGLHHALAVLQHLRAQDPRFVLHVFGDYSLWGSPDHLDLEQPGVYLHGTLPQKQLIPLLYRHSFLLALQDFEEPFGISVIEAKRAGIIPIASPVGALPEIIRDRVDGILVDGPPESEETRHKAAETILALLDTPQTLAYMRRMAMNTPWTWEGVAEVWGYHWHTLFSRAPATERTQVRRCLCCGTRLLGYPDGWRCPQCATFVPRWF